MLKRIPNKLLRDRLVSFGVSCGLHVLLLLCLSLIAIGTGAVRGSQLLLAAPADASEETEVAADAELLLTPELPTVPEDARPVEFELVDFEASAPKPAAVPEIVPAAPTNSEASPTKSKGKQARPRGSPANDLEGMQALAATGIQNRVAKAGGKQGEVQFALAWRDFNDVDLHIITPAGERISHQHRKSQCGGLLDVDMNVSGESDEPVENVRWLRNAPWGRYTVLINFFKLHANVRSPQRQSNYQLLAELGKESEMREGAVGFGVRQVAVWRFHYVPSSFSAVEREHMLQKLEALQAREEAQAAPVLEKALQAKGTSRQRMLQSVVQSFPHTDAAIEALQSMDGEVTKQAGSQ